MKQNNSNLVKKLRNYSILVGSALTAGTANAQIVHKTINTHVTGALGYHLDLNGDGIPDIQLRIQNSVGFEIAEAIFETNGSAQSMVGTSYRGIRANPRLLPSIDSAGQVISSGNKFYNAKPFLYSSKGHEVFLPPILAGYSAFSHRNLYGNWTGKTGFLAIRINAGGNSYYGWARLHVSKKSDTIYVFDYAYQSTAGAPINAGDTGTQSGINTHKLQNVLINASGKIVTVKYQNAGEGMTIIVRDMLGKEVQAAQTTNERYELNLADAAGGVYIVTVKSRDAEMTRKVLIQ